MKLNPEQRAKAAILLEQLINEEVGLEEIAYEVIGLREALDKEPLDG